MEETQNYNLNFELDIEEVDGFPDAVFRVRIQPEEGSKTTHTVHVAEDYWEQLTGGKMSVEGLVRASFEFLLARESNAAILQDFDLKKISEYFPDYENTITRSY